MCTCHRAVRIAAAEGHRDAYSNDSLESTMSMIELGMSLTRSDEAGARRDAAMMGSAFQVSQVCTTQWDSECATETGIRDAVGRPDWVGEVTVWHLACGQECMANWLHSG